MVDLMQGMLEVGNSLVVIDDYGDSKYVYCDGKIV